MKEIDIDTWNRKEHFHFITKMDSPFFGLTANVKCTNAYKYVKNENISFFAYYLFYSQRAAHAIKEFKYRIIENKIYEMDIMHAGATLAREDHTFAFALIKYDEDFNLFYQNIVNEKEAVKNSTGLRLNTDRGLNLIRYTTIPWISFTGMLHPTNFNNNESIPRISFGKMFEENNEKYLPVSVEANHGLMDGYHIGEFFRIFEELLESNGKRAMSIGL